MQSWKRSKTSWMGHGAWMGITWGTWKMGEWGRSIAPKMLHVSGGYVSRAQATRASKCVLGRSSKLDMFWWVVSFKVFVLRLMFLGVRFSTSENECQATTKTGQVSMSVCSEAPRQCPPSWAVTHSYWILFSKIWLTEETPWNQKVFSQKKFKKFWNLHLLWTHAEFCENWLVPIL